MRKRLARFFRSPFRAFNVKHLYGSVRLRRVQRARMRYSGAQPFRKQRGNDERAQMKSAYGMTNREFEAIEKFAARRSAQAITERFTLSKHTVKAHLRRAYAKTDVHSRQKLLDLIEETSAAKKSCLFVGKPRQGVITPCEPPTSTESRCDRVLSRRPQRPRSDLIASGSPPSCAAKSDFWQSELSVFRFEKLRPGVSPPENATAASCNG